MKRLGPAIASTTANERELLREVTFFRPFDVVADEQIQIAIVVVVEPAGTGAPLRIDTADIGVVSHIDELATVVAEQPILADRRKEQVRVAVVVVVSASDTHAVEGDVESDLFRHVGESALSVVAVHCLSWLRSILAKVARIPRPAARVHKDDVLIAIAVEIKKRTAAPHRLWQQFVAVGPVLVDELDPRFRRDVGEANLRRLHLCWGRRRRRRRWWRDDLSR